MSQLVDFYLEDGYDSENRSFAQLFKYTDEQFESAHDVIQWLFPLKEKSNYNTDAPILTEEDIQKFRNSSTLQSNLTDSFWKFVGFLGLKDGEDKLEFADNFEQRVPTVWAAFNHNMLRITRVLKSTMLLGLDDEAAKLYAKCKEMYESGKYGIPSTTFKYWTEAIYDET